MDKPIPIILASKSRDRKTLFEAAKIPIFIIPGDFDEDSVTESNPYKKVQEIALGKAKYVRDLLINNPNLLLKTPISSLNKLNIKKIFSKKKIEKFIIIAADTMVLFEGNLIGKAHSLESAREILKKLSGNSHKLLTGVCVLSHDISNKTMNQSSCECFFDEALVHFQDLSESEIDHYLTHDDEHKGRAGAYSLRERAALFIDKIDGSPSNVIGLPMAKVRDVLKKYGIDLLNYLYM